MTRVIIIGSGWYGLVTAKTYLQLYPEVDLTIIDGDKTVGGVWSKERLYPNLFAQITYPLFEYYDQPMRPEGLSAEGYISGQTIHTYFQEYAEKHDLLKHIRFSTWVQKVRRTPEGKWSLSITYDGGEEVLECDKLVVANGPTSKPRMPDIPRDSFIPPVLHSKDIGRCLKQIEDPNVRSITVVGAAKSAFDAVYIGMKMGKQVNWLIRENGAGAMNMYPPKYLKIINIMDLACMRFVSKMSPSILATDDWWYQVFQHSWLGSRVTKGFWGALTILNNWYAGYSKSENAEKLRPTPNSAFWCNNGLGCMSVPGFWKMFHQGLATVHRDHLSKFEGRTVHLKSGKTIDTDMVIMCTGWDDDISIFDRETIELLGIPSRHYDIALSPEVLKTDRAAAKVVDDHFPVLREGPPNAPNAESDQRSWRLYRRMVSPTLTAQGDRSLCFMGQIHSISTAMLSGIQALWVVSYMEGKVAPPSLPEMEREAAEFNAWTKKRYLDAGKKFPYSIYDFLPYIDTLLRDVKINPSRKDSLLKEYFEPYGPRDYSTVIREWKERHTGKA